MPIQRSHRYRELQAETHETYFEAPKSQNDVFWWKKYAPKWRSRVGGARLTAERATSEAAGLLKSVNPTLFRDNPELLSKLNAARTDSMALAIALGSDNWARFDRA